MIRDIQAHDLPAVVEIFNHYVTHDHCTFQLQPVSLQEMTDKVNELICHYPFLVMELQEQVVAFAYGSRWRAKQAYDLSVESTIYVCVNHKHRGIGTQLYRALIENLSARGFHLAVACITLPNASSIALHERLGFNKVGVFHEAGKKFDTWHDVGFWQKKLNHSEAQQYIEDL